MKEFFQTINFTYRKMTEKENERRATILIGREKMNEKMLCRS